MPTRRQFYQWEVEDLGQLPPKRLSDLNQRYESIFTSGIGTATITKSLRTADDEYIVIEHFGSTPGIWPNNGNNWVPGGYVNFKIGTTYYFENLDGRVGVGLSGDTAPYPVSLGTGTTPNISAAPSMKNWFAIEIPPKTDWDIVYFLANAITEPVELLPLENATQVDIENFYYTDTQS